MQRTRKQSITTKTKHWTVDRADFLDSDERRMLMEITEEMAREDAAAGRHTWGARWMLVHLAMYSGLRVGEIARLQVQDLNLGANPSVRVWNGKGGKHRTVYIDHRLRDHLSQFTQGMHPTRTPFPTGAKALYFSFKRALTEANLLRPTSHRGRQLSIHSARHTYATLLLARTGNIRYVQKQLGHSHLSTTAAYADILPELNGTLANMILDEP